MNTFSSQLLADLSAAEIDLTLPRPSLLFTADQLPTIRIRARQWPGAVDRIVAAAAEARQDAKLFGPEPRIPYLSNGPILPLATAALVLDDGSYAARALEGVEVLFSSPPEEWVALPHRPMRCDHAMLNVAANVAIAMDLCAAYWPADAVEAVAARLHDRILTLFLETWQKQDAHWSEPGYAWNWKIMCCGEAGLTALSCREAVADMPSVLNAAAAGVLQILDRVPAEGDWPEGPGYWLATLGYGLRFGLALRYATHGAADLLAHPVFGKTGDFLVQVTQPDGQVYNFNDNALSLGPVLDYVLLMAREKRRGDWARVGRLSDAVTVLRLAWEDDDLESADPPLGSTVMLFPWTGLATMRSGWDRGATYVGLKCGPSDVGHSHLDANSLVVSSRGRRLLVDPGLWPYAHFQGFFDTARRFDFDGNATVGHSSLLVDGQGQEFGKEFAGQIVRLESADDVVTVSGDATRAYGGRLTRFWRTVVFARPDLVLVRDQVSAAQPHLLEWLFHHQGQAEGDHSLTWISREGVSLSLARVRPEQAECWRVSDVARTSYYTASNTGEPAVARIQYRGFGPFHPCSDMDVLWAIHVGDRDQRPQVEASLRQGGLGVRVRYHDGRLGELAVPAL